MGGPWVAAAVRLGAARSTRAAGPLGAEQRMGPLTAGDQGAEELTVMVPPVEVPTEADLMEVVQRAAIRTMVVPTVVVPTAAVPTVVVLTEVDQRAEVLTEVDRPAVGPTAATGSYVLPAERPSVDPRRPAVVRLDVREPVGAFDDPQLEARFELRDGRRGLVRR
jgi:hypothetical protein